MPKARKEIINQRFGKLVVISESAIGAGIRKAVVLCDCGNTKEVIAANLMKGTTTSCGCFHKSQITTHGKSQLPVYKVWAGMQASCNDPTHHAYINYGGRGINICSAWDSVENFTIWANKSGYATDLTLDRKDNNKGYGPDNCRWVTRTTQQRNRRPNTDTSSKYIGVSYFKLTNKWKVTIGVEGKRTHLGYFHTELAAAIARDQYIINNKLTDFTMNGVL